MNINDSQVQVAIKAFGAEATLEMPQSTASRVLDVAIPIIFTIGLALAAAAIVCFFVASLFIAIGLAAGAAATSIIGIALLVKRNALDRQAEKNPLKPTVPTVPPLPSASVAASNAAPTVIVPTVIVPNSVSAAPGTAPTPGTPKTQDAKTQDNGKTSTATEPSGSRPVVHPTGAKPATHLDIVIKAEKNLKAQQLEPYIANKVKHTTVELDEIVRAFTSSSEPKEEINFRLREAVEEAAWIMTKIPEENAQSKMVLKLVQSLQKANQLMPKQPKPLKMIEKQASIKVELGKTQITKLAFSEEFTRRFVNINRALELADVMRLDLEISRGERLLAFSESGPFKLPKKEGVYYQVLLKEAKELSSCLKSIEDLHGNMMQAIKAGDMENVLKHSDSLLKTLQKLPYKRFSESIVKDWLQIIDELETIFDQLSVAKQIMQTILNVNKVGKEPQADSKQNFESIEQARDLLKDICLPDLLGIQTLLKGQLEAAMKELHQPASASQPAPSAAPGIATIVSEDPPQAPEVDANVPDAPPAPDAPDILVDAPKPAVTPLKPSTVNLNKAHNTENAPNINVGLLKDQMSMLKKVVNAELAPTKPQANAFLINNLTKRRQDLDEDSDDEESDVTTGSDSDSGSEADCKTKAVESNSATASKFSITLPSSGETQQKEKDAIILTVKVPPPNEFVNNLFQSIQSGFKLNMPTITVTTKPATVKTQDEEWEEDNTDVVPSTPPPAAPLPEPKVQPGKLKLDGTKNALTNMLNAKLGKPAVVKSQPGGGKLDMDRIQLFAEKFAKIKQASN